MNADRWRQWLAGSGPALLLFARQWSASQADAEDAVQEGFVRFWKNRGKARDEVAYLHLCVRAAAMDLSRADRRRAARQRVAAVAELTAFGCRGENTERHLRIEQALAQLPGDQREVTVMKIWGGLTFAQIAEVLGTSVNTAASRYRLALARLADELAQEVALD